jgi:hypothetical protein
MIKIMEEMKESYETGYRNGHLDNDMNHPPSFVARLSTWFMYAQGYEDGYFNRTKFQFPAKV